jgi:acetyl-CoA C-acetyltransferase
VAALPSRSATAEGEGDSTVETYTVLHERDGSASSAIVTALLGDGTRAVGKIEDAAAMASLMESEGAGRPVRLLGGGKAELT